MDVEAGVGDCYDARARAVGVVLLCLWARKRCCGDGGRHTNVNSMCTQCAASSPSMSRSATTCDYDVFCLRRDDLSNV